jgi:uncharacterized protein (TIGR02466 family)
MKLRGRFMQHQIADMFAVPVYRASLNRAFTAAEMTFFQHELRDAVMAISNYSSKNKNILKSPQMTSIKTVIQQHLDNYFKIIFSTSNKVQLQITQSWLTQTSKGQSHHTHTHPNSVVSGVLYINLAPLDGISFFRNEDAQWYELIKMEENYYNASRYFVQTAIGEIILFPSHIRHGVHTVSEDIQRVSLSFNTFFSGEIGKEEFASALRISLE